MNDEDIKNDLELEYIKEKSNSPYGLLLEINLCSDVDKLMWKMSRAEKYLNKMKRAKGDWILLGPGVAEAIDRELRNRYLNDGE